MIDPGDHMAPVQIPRLSVKVRIHWMAFQGEGEPVEEFQTQQEFQGLQSLVDAFILHAATQSRVRNTFPAGAVISSLRADGEDGFFLLPLQGGYGENTALLIERIEILEPVPQRVVCRLVFTRTEFLGDLSTHRAAIRKERRKRDPKGRVFGFLLL